MHFPYLHLHMSSLYECYKTRLWSWHTRRKGRVEPWERQFYERPKPSQLPRVTRFGPVHLHRTGQIVLVKPENHTLASHVLGNGVPASTRLPQPNRRPFVINNYYNIRQNVSLRLYLPYQN